MTTHIDYPAIAAACDSVSRRCRKIANRDFPSSCWLFDKVMRTFEHPATVGVTYEVDERQAGPGFYATICRDGRWFIGRDPEPDLG